MKIFTVKVQTASGVQTYQALAYSTSACIAHAFARFSEVLGVTAFPSR